MRSQDHYSVLFLCTGNSARSILAEAILNHRGGGRFKAFSAGSFPTGEVNRFALDQLERQNVPITGLRSKSWDEFSGEQAPSIDFVITVCDRAAAEVCPVWPGKPVSAHWGLADPAAVRGSDSEVRAAFDVAFRLLSKRIDSFTTVPLASMDRSAIIDRLQAVGQLQLD